MGGGSHEWKDGRSQGNEGFRETSVKTGAYSHQCFKKNAVFCSSWITFSFVFQEMLKNWDIPHLEKHQKRIWKLVLRSRVILPTSDLLRRCQMSCCCWCTSTSNNIWEKKKRKRSLYRLSDGTFLNFMIVITIKTRWWKMTWQKGGWN